MITPKHFIGFFFSMVMLFASVARSQTPTMSFDGNQLRVSVPSGHLELTKANISNDAVRDCMEWGGRDTCLFMSSPDPYILYPKGLTTKDQVSVQGFFEGKPITITVEMNPGQNKTHTGETKEPETNLHLILILVAVLLLLLIVMFIVLLKRKKKHVKEPENNTPNVLDMVNDESVVYAEGLEHVRSRLNEYQVFDMDKVFEDTCVSKVYLSTALIKKLYDFFNNSLEEGGRTNETGCYILGCWDYEHSHPKRYEISLEYMVEPGDDADFGEYSLNFGKKIGVNMASVLNTLATKSKRDYVLTCWMHSHPGLGLFLSNQDLIVQRQLTYPEHRNRLIAIVIDTNSPDLKMGFFTAKADGKMNNQEEVKQWFSFEEIYHQSREMNRNRNTSDDLLAEYKPNPDFFNIDLIGDGLCHLGFSGHAINQIDNALFSNMKGVIGYLFGEEEHGYLQVGCCLPYENDEKCGCLINDSHFTSDSLSKYAPELNGCLFLISCNDDEVLDVWTRDASGGFSKAGSTTMTLMKEWIRRKRV